MDEQTRQAVANFRFGLIAPLVSRDLRPAERYRLLREAARQSYRIPGSSRTRIGLRTLERYWHDYRQGGWEALLPQVRNDKHRPRAITPEILARAAALREEVPTRSVTQIIAMLELAGVAERGVLKRSTLSQHLAAAGKTRRALLSRATTARRFEAPYPGALWQGDCQHTLHLPDPERPGRKRQVYLIAFLDDHSRLVPHGQFYWEEKLPRLEDCLKKAILRHGVPEQIYVDNGAIYSSRHLERICGRLGIRLSHSRPYQPRGRGKIEKFFRTVDQSFVPEAYQLIGAGKLHSLAELNALFFAWLEVAYHGRPHGSTKQTPSERFARQDKPLRRIDPLALREIFLWEEQRTIDKTGCVGLYGNRYEVGDLVGKVTLRFDPYDLSEIQVWQDGVRHADARPLQLRRAHHQAVRPSPPPSSPTTGLNFLELLGRHHAEQQQARAGRLRYGALKPEGQP